MRMRSPELRDSRSSGWPGPRVAPSDRPIRRRRCPSTSSRRTTYWLRSCASATRVSRRVSSPGCPSAPAAQLFGGLLRPDALAGVRVGDRLATLFIERDLGTERGEGLADKIRRYASLLARAPEARVWVAFVVESHRRARSILDVARRRAAGSARFVAGVDHLVRADPLGAPWWDGEATRATRDLAASATTEDLPILMPGCLSDAETVAALDDRAALLLPELRPFLQR